MYVSKCLNFTEGVGTQIFGKAGRGACRGQTRDTTARKRDDGEQTQDDARFDDDVKLGACLDTIDEVRCNEGNRGLHDRLEDDEDHGDDHRPLVLAQTTRESFKNMHACDPSFLLSDFVRTYLLYQKRRDRSRVVLKSKCKKILNERILRKITFF